MLSSKLYHIDGDLKSQVKDIQYNPPSKVVDISVARSGPLPSIVGHDGLLDTPEKIDERFISGVKDFELDRPFELTVQYNDER